MNAIPLKYWIKLLILAFALESIAQIPSPANPQSQSILLLDATAHLGNGEVIPRAAIGFREGKIDMVLAAFDIRMDSTKYDTIIHLGGKHIYPGFIAPNSKLGLVEIDAVRASRDFDDVGDFNPHIRSITAYNTESRITPTVRSNGVLYAQVSPRGGKISGSSSIFALDGWNWEDAVIEEDDGIHLNWPIYRKQLQKKSKEEQKKNASKDRYTESVKSIKDFFNQALVYHKEEYVLEKNLRFESMKRLFEKKAKLYIHLNRVQEITDALYLFDQYEIDIVLVGAYEAYLVSELIKDRDIPVLLRRVHALPMHEDEAVDLPYRLPKILSDQGILVALENSGGMEAMGTRNLPFYAGTASAYGLDKEKALSMITLNSAKILGVDNRIGSLEIGKDASLFVSIGDALDMKSNQVEMAFIEGKLLDLDNPQKYLYRKYSKKYQD